MSNIIVKFCRFEQEEDGWFAIVDMSDVPLPGELVIVYGKMYKVRNRNWVIEPTKVTAQIVVAPWHKEPA